MYETRVGASYNLCLANIRNNVYVLGCRCIGKIQGHCIEICGIVLLLSWFGDTVMSRQPNISFAVGQGKRTNSIARTVLPSSNWQPTTRDEVRLKSVFLQAMHTWSIGSNINFRDSPTHEWYKHTANRALLYNLVFCTVTKYQLIHRSNHSRDYLVVLITTMFSWSKYAINEYLICNYICCFRTNRDASLQKADGTLHYV